LRLAALELHLGQGHALPFIAMTCSSSTTQTRQGGLEALASLSEKTQVIFLSHTTLVPTVQAVFA